MSVVRPAATQSARGLFGARATLRANPCPEVTDPFCRLPLLTLFYRPEASHLGDLLRSWVRPTARASLGLWPTDFQGSSRAHRTPHQWRRSAGPSGLSPVRPLPGPSRDPRQQETTTLAGALADVSVVLSVVADSYDGSMMSVREYRPDSLSRKFAYREHVPFRIDSPACDCR